MSQRKVIRFLGSIDEKLAKELISKVEELINSKVKNILLLISSSGGSISSGVSIYNFLKGAPISVDTANYGSVDSIATVVYSAGKKRYSVPSARFLIHNVTYTPSGKTPIEERKLREELDSLQRDRENISKIVSDNCKKSQKEISDMMVEGTTLNAKEAKSLGLVTDIKDKLFEEGEEIISLT